MAVPEFRTEKVTDRITRIFAHSGELMYLVEGEEKAALLDTGSGIGFFRPLVESLTDKPLNVLITHGHVDHAMGASEFPSGCVYINKEDAYIYEQHSTHAFRKAGLSMMGPAGEAVVPEEDFTPEGVADELRRLVEDAPYRERMLADYAAIRESLGGSGASRRVARRMIEELHK